MKKIQPLKCYWILLTAVFISGCIKKPRVEFAGVATGVKSGVFIVKTTGDSTVIGENIKDGKFRVKPQDFKEPGYYMMNITDDANDDKHEPFEIYLESGKYTIETAAGELYKYPKITSSSKTQEQLSAFNSLLEQLSVASKKTADSLNAEVKTKGNGMSPVAYTQLLNKVAAAETAMATDNVLAFKKFVQQYPNSDISAHLMTKLDYEDDPEPYYAIFKTLSAAARNSDDGKDIGDKLSHLVKLVAGAKAPAIVGTMPDGKPFDPKTISTKYILIDFWRAGNDFSRRNHLNLNDLLNDKKIKSKLSIVSISLDTHKDWWTDAIRQDNMDDWANVCDLKGDDSPNAVNWSISTIPTYYLLDANWNIVERNIEINSINFEVSDYIGKHL